MTNITSTLAELVVHSKPDSEALKSAQKGLIDYFASSLTAKDSGTGKHLKEWFKEEGGHMQVPLIGQHTSASAKQAALFNGYLGHALDLDDVHTEVRGHPSTVIIPALLSAGASGEFSGKRFLEAYTIGVEVMARMGLAIGNEHYTKGWHNTATLGGIAAACACAYLKEFTVKQTERVIGLAATQASGMRNQFGTETKPLHAGLAAEQAYSSVRFIEFGLSSSRESLDGENGFLNLYGADEHQADLLTSDWGHSWRITSPGLWFKVYPFCSAAFHAADATFELLTQSNVQVENIQRIEVIFPPGGDAALVNKCPKNTDEGRFSVEYVVALILIKKSVSLDDFNQGTIGADIRALMDKINRRHDPDITASRRSAPKGRFTIVRLFQEDGEVLEARVDAPTGSPQKPLKLSQLEQKLRDSCDETQFENIKKAVNELSSVEQLTNLLKALY